MILGAQRLRDLHKNWEMISPFKEKYTSFNGISGGLSAAGYDVSVEFDALGEQYEMCLYGGEFKLASTVEFFKMPPGIIGIVHDKSTWARRGITVQNTVIEPMWNGHLTLELANHGSPIAQIIFHEVDGADAYDGKYQNQERGPVRAR